MKKLILSALTLAAVAFGFIAPVSCSSNDDALADERDKGLVEISIALPDELSSRAVIGDGTLATDLYYAIYDQNKAVLAGYKGVTVAGFFNNSSLSNTLTLNLVNGREYTVAFWAMAADAPYTFDWTLATVAMNYQNGTPANAENRDAFFGSVTFTVKPPQPLTVELHRPFAQLNILTNDYQAAKKAGITIEKTAVEISSDSYSTLNLLTGVASQPVAIQFGAASILSGQTAPTTVSATGSADGAWTWLSMNYLLIGDDNALNNGGQEAISTVTLKTNGATPDKTYGNIPVKRNYRTNIVGGLLTDAMDITVEIKPEFSTPDYNVTQN